MKGLKVLDCFKAGTNNQVYAMSLKRDHTENAKGKLCARYASSCDKECRKPSLT